MSNEITIPEKPKLPTLAELISDTEMSLKDNALTVLLNQPPPESWLLLHPVATIDKINAQGKKEKVPLPYLPIERVEWLLVSIYGKWKSEIKNVYHIANSVLVTVTVTVINPVTGEPESHDGLGAAALQTDQGKSAIDWNFIKSNAVQIGAPAAESYAIKDACEKFGRIFGKDLGRKYPIGYDSLLKGSKKVTLEDLQELYELKKDILNDDQRMAIESIINDKDVVNYKKTFTNLSKL